MAERYRHLSGFELSNCYINKENVIAFVGQKWDNSDSLEVRSTSVFYYDGSKEPKKRWSGANIGKATGLLGCAVSLPEKQWILMTEDGEVCTEDGFEEPVTEIKYMYFNNVKSIKHGHAYAVGPLRNVYFRQKANKWVKLDNGLFPQGENTDLEDTGFRDIDGFSEQDLYACGGKGDLWRYDGNLWQQIDCPTNANLKNICCADDGFVYVTTNNKEVLKGREDAWKIISEDKPKEILEVITYYEGKVMISTISEIYTIDGEEFKPVDLSKMPKMNSKAHIAANDQILLVAGKDNAAIYDGREWSVILESEQ